MVQVPLPVGEEDELIVHAGGEGDLSRLQLPDLFAGYVQLPQKLYAEKSPGVLQVVFPVAVGRIPAGGDQALRLIETDILFGNACQFFHLIDLHGHLVLSGPVLMG